MGSSGFPVVLPFNYTHGLRDILCQVYIWVGSEIVS